LIRFERVSFRYGPSTGNDILHEIDISIERGEWIAVTGANGSGKSVFCKLMAGLHSPRYGNILIEGEDPRKAVGSNGSPSVGIAFQNPDSQFVTSSVKRELLFGLGNIGVIGMEAEDRALRAASLFELEHLLERNPHMLSGGEKQRLLLACIWAMRPEIVILDEPFSFLDAASRQSALDTVRRSFHDEGKTVVWTTLDPAELELADRVIYIEKGSIAFDGDPVGALDAIPQGVLIDRGPGSSEGIQRDRDEESSEAVPGSGEGVEPEPPVALIEEAILSYGDEGFRLDVPSLEIRKGEALGVLGPSGSGKTTLLLGCSGLMSLEQGRLALFGEPVAKRSDFPAGRIAFLFQSPEVGFFAPTVAEEIALGHRRFGDGRPDEEAAREALTSVGLDPDSFMKRSPFHLSQGEKRLVALASQLVLPAELLFLDEPALFLDGGARKNLCEAIDGLITSGSAIAIASHDTPFIESLSTIVVTLADGSILPR
jgi:energy-coupling factor transport system ATP-binding protein